MASSYAFVSRLRPDLLDKALPIKAATSINKLDFGKWKLVINPLATWNLNKLIPTDTDRGGSAAAGSVGQN